MTTPPGQVPEALRRAAELEHGYPWPDEARAAAAELRRLHAQVAALTQPAQVSAVESNTAVAVLPKFEMGRGYITGSIGGTAYREGWYDALAAVRASNGQAPAGAAYGATDFGWIDWRPLTDGDKRLMTLVVGLFGNEHQAFSDVEALIDRAFRSTAHQPTPSPQAAQAAPAAGAVAMIAMVDAAMVEMKNITPPIRRSECERLIYAALAAAPTPAAQADSTATPSQASIAWNALRDATDPLGEAGTRIMEHVRVFAQRQYEAGLAEGRADSGVQEDAAQPDLDAWKCERCHGKGWHWQSESINHGKEIGVETVDLRTHCDACEGVGWCGPDAARATGAKP